ncbi:hypothetical protein LFL96_32840 [Paraburkholderia sp. D15]|uniref:hypothetical protein n=1 Tax=Paraburkholderia sp. D15 TaxID=2880218 RepID=UPI002478F14B|nr:hypothetical protein [Paraburkholderia sp. D15]WGS52959.1 hypothetical protein LFL96_32840 [Paraburkholderia sp. D15]
MITQPLLSSFRRYCRFAIPALCIAALNTPVFAQQGADGDASPSVASKVPGIEIAKLSALPKAPASASSRRDCQTLTRLKSEGGKIADAQGWGVTGETRLGSYDVVSFAGKFEAGTSGSCDIDAGNVALFRGRQLVALVYAASHSKQTISNIVTSPVNGGIRILDGDLVPMPVADLRLAGGNAIEVDPLPAEDPICDGRGAAPNVYGQSVRQARKTLIAQGWTPVRSTASDPLAKELRASGIVEVSDCAGTGFAFCSYYYRKGNIELNLTSFGDGDAPTVSDYGAICDRSRWHHR